MTSHNTPVVTVSSVSKTIRQRPILRDVSLTVAEGEVAGIYGPNGSGKSMLLRVISGLILPDTGTVHVFGTRVGHDTEFPPQLGALIDGPGFLSQYSGLYNLELLASIRNEISTERIRETLRRVGLDPDDKRPVRTYSMGMRQRLGIAQAIMEQPRLLLLDEPSSALDFEGEQRIAEMIQELQQQGVTVILVSHKPAELGDLCTALYEMRDGQLREAG